MFLNEGEIGQFEHRVPLERVTVLDIRGQVSLTNVVFIGVSDPFFLMYFHNHHVCVSLPAINGSVGIFFLSGQKSSNALIAIAK